MLPTRRVVAAGLALGVRAQDTFTAILSGDGRRSAAVIGLSVAASGRGQRVRFADARGWAHVAPDRPMTPRAAMRVASISKHATAVGFMRLVERGRVALDDDVSDVLGFRLRHPAFPTVRITPRALLSHTSTLRNGPSYPVPFGRPLAAAFTPGAAHWDGGAWFGPVSEPPGFFTYADVNFAVVAQMIERLSGERFDRYMTAHVFAPLGLDVGFNWSGVSQARRDGAATLYRRGRDDAHWNLAADWTPQIDDRVPRAAAAAAAVTRAPEAADRRLESYVPGENGFVFAPQGGLRAGVDDLARFGAMLARGGALDGVRILRAETVAAMCEPVWRFDPRRPNGNPYGGGAILAYGLGTVVLTGTLGPKGDDLFEGSAGFVGHLGEAYGLYSGLWWKPGAGAIAYAVNGVPAPGEQNPGVRSGFTRWEERLAGALAARVATREARA